MRFYWLIFLMVLRDINSKIPTNYDSFKNALLCKYVTKSHENFAQIIILLLKSQKMQTFVLNRNVVEQSTDFLRKKCSRVSLLRGYFFNGNDSLKNYPPEKLSWHCVAGIMTLTFSKISQQISIFLKCRDILFGRLSTYVPKYPA